MSRPWKRGRFRRDHRWAPDHMSEYLDGELAPRGDRRMARHAEECPECRGLLRNLRRMLGLLRGLPQSHPPADQEDLAAAVRRRLDEPGD